jgi:hypothetical protein
MYLRVYHPGFCVVFSRNLMYLLAHLLVRVISLRFSSTRIIGLFPRPKAAQGTAEEPEHHGTYKCHTDNHANHEAPNRFA